MVDIVKKKIKISNYFPSFESYEIPESNKEEYFESFENSEVTKGKNFIMDEFLNIFKAKKSTNDQRFCIPFFTTSVSTKNACNISKKCENILCHENLVQLNIF